MSRPAFPSFALSTGMLWLLAGAMYKLFEGSPNDLPEIVKDQSPLDAWNTMRAAIAIELAIVGLVIALPRIGWLFLAAQFGVFIAILAPMVAAGETSCGCFGGNIEIDPKWMVGIDGGLLFLILLSRPWRLKGAGLGAAAFLPLLAVAIAAPALKLQEPELPTLPAKAADNVVATSNNDGGADAEADPASAIENAAEEAVDAIDDAGTDLANAAEEVVEAGIDAATEATDPPVEETTDEDASELPEFVELVWSDWDGKDFYDTDIGLMSTLDPTGAVLPESHVVVYRRTCEVCQEHLEELFTSLQNDPNHLGGKTLILLRIEEAKDATAENLCALPEQNLVAEKVTLPALKRGYGITTPMSFDVNGENKVENVVDVREIMGH